MNKYLVAVYHYFSGYEDKIVEAANKSDAIEIAKENAKIHGAGNYDIDRIKVLKKLKK